MKINLDINEFDELLTEKIKEGIIEPLVDKIEEWVINDRIIEKHINEGLSNAMEQQLTKAIKYSFEAGGFNSYLREIRVDVNEIVERKINSIVSDRLSFLDEEINKLAKKKDNLDVSIKSFTNLLHSMGNVVFDFINVPEENYPSDVESYVINTLKESNRNIIVTKFNKSWRGHMERHDYRRGHRVSYQILDRLAYELENVGAPDLIVIDDELIYFIEVKSVKDSIKMNQILWAKNNPDYLVKYLFVNKVSADIWGDKEK